MNKVLLILTGILAGLYVVLSLLDMKGEYAVEQILWKADKRLAECARSPEVIPDKVFEQIAAQYQKVIKNYPKSTLVPTAHVFLGRVYIVKKDYDTARQKLNEAIAKFPGNAAVGADALAMIGSSYEVQGNWTEALNAYNKLRQEYPLTDFGLNIPFYVAAYYEKNGHAQNAQNALDEAIGYYLKLSTENPNSTTGLKSLKLLSNCYIAQKNWVEAVNVLAKIIAQYPTPEIAVSAIDTINAIAVSQLKDYDMAIGIYRRLVDSNPNHPLGKMLKKTIEALEERKNKKAASNKGKK